MASKVKRRPYSSKPPRQGQREERIPRGSPDCTCDWDEDACEQHYPPSADRMPGAVKEECYFLVCSCGVEIRDDAGKPVHCACPVRGKTAEKPHGHKRRVVVQEGCDYCARQAAIRRAVRTMRLFPSFRRFLA